MKQKMTEEEKKAKAEKVQRRTILMTLSIWLILALPSLFSPERLALIVLISIIALIFYIIAILVQAFFLRLFSPYEIGRIDRYLREEDKLGYIWATDASHPASPFNPSSPFHPSNPVNPDNIINRFN